MMIKSATWIKGITPTVIDIENVSFQGSTLIIPAKNVVMKGDKISMTMRTGETFEYNVISSFPFITATKEGWMVSLSHSEIAGDPLATLTALTK